MAKSIYFIGDGAGHVKIGMSDDPAKRLRQMQTSSPRPLRLLWAVPSRGEDDERWAHDTFYENHILGEWYRYDGRVKDFVAWLREWKWKGMYQEAALEWGPCRVYEAEVGDFLYRCHEVGC